MDDPVRVRCRQRIGDFSAVAKHVFHWLRPPLQSLRQALAFHVLHDQVIDSVLLTDVVQATVVCGSALRAEALAKAAVIAGTVDGLALLERVGVAGAVILTEGGETLALPQTLALLAE